MVVHPCINGLYIVTICWCIPGY